MLNHGFVYLLCDGEYFKIGMTKRNDINKRIKELQTGNTFEIWLYSYYETDYPLKIEQMMHAKYKIKQVKNEWYNLTVNDVLNFEKECADCEQTYKYLKSYNNPFI